jgi:hypothetical protein
MNDAVIVGEQEAGRAIQCRRAINKLISTSNSSTFDLAELLFEAKSKNYYAGWGFESFSRYAKSLEIKYTKSYYLVRVVENMKAAGLERAAYEPVGMGKLRIISRLKPETTYNGVPVNLLIRELTLKAGDMSLEEVQIEVDTILGLTADESMVWLNIRCKKMARENVIKPALSLAKKHIGTKPAEGVEGEEGQQVDASDGAALEMICANFLADPNWAIEEVVTPKPTTDNGTPEMTESFDGVGTAKEDAAIEAAAGETTTDIEF